MHPVDLFRTLPARATGADLRSHLEAKLPAMLQAFVKENLHASHGASLRVFMARLARALKSLGPKTKSALPCATWRLPCGLESGKVWEVVRLVTAEALVELTTKRALAPLLPGGNSSKATLLRGYRHLMFLQHALHPGQPLGERRRKAALKRLKDMMELITAQLEQIRARDAHLRAVRRAATKQHRHQRDHHVRCWRRQLRKLGHLQTAKPQLRANDNRRRAKKTQAQALAVGEAPPQLPVPSLPELVEYAEDIRGRKWCKEARKGNRECRARVGKFLKHNRFQLWPEETRALLNGLLLDEDMFQQHSLELFKAELKEHVGAAAAA